MLKLEVHLLDENSLSMENILSSSFLSDSDIDYLAKYKVEEVKKEKAISLLFKNKYIGEYHLNEFGKPLSDKCFFNISHTSGVVVFIKDNYPIGIDIESKKEVSEELIDYISSSEEKEYIRSDINFLEIWTNKESLVKAIGTGLKNKIKEIPALPINGKKSYQNKTFYSIVTRFKDYVISVTRSSELPFEIEIKEETL